MKTFPVSEDILMMAFRHVLGRKGMPLEICVNYLLAYWNDLSQDLRTQIIKEIEVFVARGEAGDRIYPNSI